MHNLFLRTFSASKQKNSRKLCKTHVQNMWQEVTSYLPCRFFSKEISKVASSSKNESIHYKSYNERGSELVGNELTHIDVVYKETGLVSP
jgi:hypothetical protein